MGTVYDTFKQHVTEARGDKLTKPIDQIAGGRVYTGAQALELGLVDRIGGLTDAAELAADHAGVEDYVLRTVPRPKDFFTQMLEDMSGQGERPSDVAMSTQPLIDLSAPPLADWLTLLDRTDPARAAAVRRALQRVELIHQHGVAMLMPMELVVR